MVWLDNDSVIVCVSVVVQIAGIASVVIARISECSARKSSYQMFFLATLLLVGMFSALMIGAGSDCSVFCAATLPVMVVGATLDMRSTSPNTPF